jgi:hypothetical protein
MMSKNKLIGLLCICTLVLVAGANITQATDETQTSSIDSYSSAGYIGYTIGRFLYTTGSAQGSSVHFTIDETTGTVTDYTMRLTWYPQYYTPYEPFIPPKTDNTTISEENPSVVDDTASEPETPSSKNTTIFTSITVDSFSPLGVPAAYYNFLSFQGNNVLMMFYDQEGGGTHYYAGQKNVTITFTVPEDANITLDPYNSLLRDEKLDDQGLPEESMMWYTIQFSIDDVVTSITTMNGMVSSEGQTITITLDAYEYLDIYSWIQYPVPEVVNDFWYSDLNIEPEKDIIEEAKNNGIIPAEGWCIDESSESIQVPTVNTQTSQTGSVVSNYYTYNDPSFNMEINTAEKNAVDVIVNSEIPTGRIVIINIEKNVLETTSLQDLLVSIDNMEITQVDTLEALMNKVETKDTTGTYYALMGEQLMTVFVYVPHFSTHTISIKTLTSSIAGVSSVLLPIVLSALFLLIIIAGILYQRQRKDE